MTDSRKSLSLCAITKDEEASLPRLLASVEGLVDEVVIADTGSKDRTVEIAEQFGAKVVHFEWCDDFSAAYNCSLDHASGEWILLLDADEELAPGFHDKIRKLIKSEEAFAYTMLRQDYYGDEVSDQNFSEMLQTRLFRNRESVRFLGRIHQQLEPRLSACANAEGRKTLASEVRFRHYGYMGDYLARKMGRTIDLLEQELQDRPDSFYYLVELGRGKLIMGDASGVDQLRLAAELVVTGKEVIHKCNASLALMLEHLLSCDVLPQDFPISLDDAEQMAVEYYADSIPILWRRALKRFKASNYRECASLLEKILKLAQDNSYSRLVSFRPDIMYGDAILNLGVCYTRMGKFKKAIACFEKLLEDSKHADSAKSNLNALRNLSRN